MTCEFLIVGGGAYGCGLAWQLASEGADVIVLEQATVPSGSSGGPGARGIRTDHRDFREYPLAIRAQEIWPTLDERLGAATGYRRIGGLRLIEEEYVGASGGRASIMAHSWMQNRLGVVTEILDRDALLELEPGLGARITNALYVASDGVAPHAQTTRALAYAARQAGARIIERTRATSLEWNSQRVVAAIAEDDRFAASKAVIIAANGGATRLLGNGQHLLPGWVVAPQAIFIDPPDSHSITHLVNHESRPLSLKPGPNGLVQVSGGWRGKWDARTRAVSVNEAIIDDMIAEAASVYPELQGSTLVEATVGGPELCSPDGIPIVDVVPGSENLYIASHWTGHGFAILPAVIEAMGAWLLEDARPSILTSFAASRFQPALARETHSVARV